MKQIRLYVDEDSGETAVVEGLRSKGIDVMTTLDAGMEGRDDDEQLAYAIERERAVYSLNLADFARLHAEFLNRGKEHFGIIVIPEQRYSVGEKIRRIADLVQSRTAEQIRNQIEFL